MKHALSLTLVFLAVGGLVSESLADVVVYSQPNENPNGPYSDGVEGQYWSTRIADNFVLSDPTNRKITQVIWWGSSENVSHQDLANFSAWVIKFYGDGDNLPDALLYDETFAKEDTNYTQTGNSNMDGGWEYEQQVELSTPLTLYIDEPYWISIGVDAIDPGEDGWRWSLNYSEGDDHSAADHFDGSGYQGREGDVAFVLWGAPASGCPHSGCEPGDIDGDCQVNLTDLSILLSHYGESGMGPGEGDLNGDTWVNLADLSILLAVYGADCN